MGAPSFVVYEHPDTKHLKTELVRLGGVRQFFVDERKVHVIIVENFRGTYLFNPGCRMALASECSLQGFKENLLAGTADVTIAEMGGNNRKHLVDIFMTMPRD